MATAGFHNYLQQIENALQAGLGIVAAALLSCRDSHVNSVKFSALTGDVDRQITRSVSQPWNELVSYHVKCVRALIAKRYLEAYQEQAALLQVLVEILKAQKEENWSLPIMYATCLDLRLVAIRADAEMQRSGKGRPGEILEKATEHLMSCFRICATDNRASAEDSKRIGMLHLVNQLFKIYYNVNKLHLCRPLIRAIDNSTFRDSFPKSQLITYRYYVGRKAMFDSDYKLANDYLSYAFQHCHRDSRNNKRLILIYLIPVKMLLGYMPSQYLLQKYDLLQFSDIVRGVKEGNFVRLNMAMSENEDFFVRFGIYLILERLKTLTYRNLFKKVSLILRTHQIPLGAFHAALKFVEMDDVDMDEVMCLIAGLIYENKIKGYISMPHQKLVVSKQTAFPSLTTAS